MGESLMQQRRVDDEGLRVVKSFSEGRIGRYLWNKPRLTTCQQPR
jgi:hypothetical protein